MSAFYQIVKSRTGSLWFQCSILILLVLFVFWNGLWGGAPRADHLIYLYQVSQYDHLSDILNESPSWNRTQSAGDFMLYRPVLYLQLGIFYFIFEYKFFYWQLASLVLHAVTVIGVFFLLRVGTLQGTPYPFLFAALFSVSFLSSELVLWSHMSGYITFCIFLVYGTIFAIKYFFNNRLLHGAICLVFYFLAQFTYELGLFASAMYSLILLFSSSSDAGRRSQRYFFSGCFFVSALLYPLLSGLDLLRLGIDVGAAPTAEASLGVLFEAFGYSLIQIIFWIFGVVLPEAYDIQAGGRAGIDGFISSGLFFYVNTVVVVLSTLLITGKFILDVCSGGFRALASHYLLALPALIFLLVYSLVISFGRALPRGLEYVLYWNLYYQYIAFVAFLGVLALYNLASAGDSIKARGPTQFRRVFLKHSKFFPIILIVLIFFNAMSTRELASDYRYTYSPSRLDVIERLDYIVETDLNDGAFFKVDTSCAGNDVLPWFSGHLRHDVSDPENVTLVDVLFADYSWFLNSAVAVDPLGAYYAVNCDVVEVSSVLEQFNADGVLAARDPGWHADMPLSFPQVLNIDFPHERNVYSIGFLPQRGFLSRAPREILIEGSFDGNSWQIFFEGRLDCGRSDGIWRRVAFEERASVSVLRISIFSNCGDPELLTLRGLAID